MAAGLPAERDDIFTQAHYDALVAVGSISGIQAFLNWYKDKLGGPNIDAWAAANPGADVGNAAAGAADAAGSVLRGEWLDGIDRIAIRAGVLLGIVAVGLLGLYLTFRPSAAGAAKLTPMGRILG